MIQNRKHYACATRSRVPADRFHTETGGFLLLRITKWPNALSCLNLTGACHLSNRSDRGRDVRDDRFHTLRIPGVSGVEMKIYETTTTTNFIENWKITNYITLHYTNYITFPPERSLQALLFSGPRSRVLARLASLSQIAELARRLSLARCIFPLPSFFINCFIAHLSYFS